MELKLDTEEFDKLSAMLIDEVATSIKVKLREAGIEGQQLEELTTEISFSVANIIDDRAAVEVDGVEVRPYLAFRTDDEKAIHCGENSCTNEFVHVAIKKLFG